MFFIWQTNDSYQDFYVSVIINFENFDFLK